MTKLTAVLLALQDGLGGVRRETEIAADHVSMLLDQLGDLIKILQAAEARGDVVGEEEKLLQ